MKKLLVVLFLVFSLCFVTSCELMGPLGEVSLGCPHSYSEWIDGCVPNCTSIGYRYRTCGLCNDTDYEFLPATGHNIEILDSYNDKETGELKVTFLCANCGNVSISDVDEEADYDQDGLNNAEELELGTDLFRADSDCDGINDIDEIRTYGTDPMLADTDGDGASDSREIFMGFDPLVPEESFAITKVPVIDEGETPDTVVPSIEIELSGDQVDSLVVERDDFFDSTTLGYVGDAYNYSVEGEISSAVIGFTFDETVFDETALPTIYAYDREAGIMTPLETTVVDGVATTEVNELSTFVLLDRSIYENELKWVDVWGLDGNVFTNIEIVFVVDDSGSMGSNDSKNERLSVARDLIDKLPSGSKLGVVRFSSSGSYSALTGSTLIDDKESAKSYLTTSYFKSSGGTYMYQAIRNAYSLFQSNDESTMKIMVVLSDGVTSDTSYHSYAVSEANAAGINVYTVGLGSDQSYFNNYLKPLSESTGGKFYYSSNAGELAAIYDDIGEKIDIVADSDGDGLSDYYEDNMVIFNGISYAPDKNNPDTDGDGLLDGEEIETVVILSVDGKQMTILGKVHSDPTDTDSDDDGIADGRDRNPLNPNLG